jgi:DNA mismatch endonuclease, patch repair protein
MENQKQRDTKPERILRSLLHRMGYRFLKDARPESSLRTRADIVFPRVRLAVFIDGCFWHSCPVHKTIPKTNTSWWEAKLESNRKRDAAADEALRASGWKVIRIWEHEAPEDAFSKISQRLEHLYTLILQAEHARGSKTR